MKHQISDHESGNGWILRTEMMMIIRYGWCTAMNQGWIMKLAEMERVNTWRRFPADIRKQSSTVGSSYLVTLEALTEMTIIRDWSGFKKQSSTSGNGLFSMFQWGINQYQFVFDLDQYFYIIVIYQLERCDRIQEEYRKLLLFIITSGQILSLMSSVDVSCII